PPPGGPPGAPPGGWGPPPGAPPPGYGPPGYGPPGAPPGGGGYGPPGAPPGGGYVPPGGGGYGPPGYGPPGQPPAPGGYGPPGGGPPGWGGPPPGMGGPPGGYPGGFVPPGAPPTGGGSGGGWTPMEALGFGWNAVMKNFAGIALPIAVVGLIAGALGAAPAGAFNYFMTQLATEIVEPSFLPMVNIGIQGVGQFFSLAISAFFTGGIVELALKAARGQKTDFGDVFGGAKYFVPMFIGIMCATLLSGIGALFCIVPGVIIGAGLLMYQWLIVDQKLPAIDALKKSWAMTDGHKLPLCIFLLLGVLVELAGVAACCVGALLVSTPMLVMASTYIYLKLKGEQPQLAAS
ncbi:MAG TPA: hypothetical protein VIW29_15065, partial [Polyangiaceae bacterium]